MKAFVYHVYSPDGLIPDVVFRTVEVHLPCSFFSHVLLASA